MEICCRGTGDVGLGRPYAVRPSKIVESKMNTLIHDLEASSIPLSCFRQ